MARGKATIKDTDPGFKKLMARLGEMGEITIGVQGEEAKQPHPQPTRWGGQDGTTVGQIAAIHELGLGVPRRSWLGAWMDENEKRVATEIKAKLQMVLSGAQSRKQALAELGYDWTKAIRDRVAEGGVKPPLAERTKAIKGHGIPLVETFTLHNSITYKVFLPQIKSIRDVAQRKILRKQK